MYSFDMVWRCFGGACCQIDGIPDGFRFLCIAVNWFGAPPCLTGVTQTDCLKSADAELGWYAGCASPVAIQCDERC